MQERLTGHVLSLYVSSLKAAATFVATRGYVCDAPHAGRSLVLLSRWAHQLCVMPAAWWLLSTPARLPAGRRLYVIWLLWALGVSGALGSSTVLSWPHRAYWMCVSLGVLPEIMYHLWCGPLASRSDPFSYCSGPAWPVGTATKPASGGGIDMLPLARYGVASTEHHARTHVAQEGVACPAALGPRRQELPPRAQRPRRARHRQGLGTRL